MKKDIRISPKGIHKAAAHLVGALAITCFTSAALAASTCTTTADTRTPSTAVLPYGDAYAVNSGGGATGGYTADMDFTLGSVYANNSQQVNTSNSIDGAPSAIYQDVREGSHFSYCFTGLTPTTTYAVILHFAELYFTLPGQREFNVSINGTQELTNFDINLEAGGPFQAIDEFFLVKSDGNGNIEIDFTKGAIDQPLVNAIEIRPDNG